ncbi:hypothetical protein KCU81_g7361, partial [Aureobasidium melanogenum]|uniref:Uncharacterized protein n=1 Tax=Aureobasidium melanogenum (strain CBS 110374) TaxID=1043003 RepID=A0A074VYP1_AURM1
MGSRESTTVSPAQVARKAYLFIGTNLSEAYGVNTNRTNLAGPHCTSSSRIPHPQFPNSEGNSMIVRLLWLGTVEDDSNVVGLPSSATIVSTSRGRAVGSITGRRCVFYVVAKPAISYLKRFLVPFFEFAATGHLFEYVDLRHWTAEVDLYTSNFKPAACRVPISFCWPKHLSLQSPSTMLAGYETSAREYVFRSLFKKASDSFDAENYDESERLCRLLLTYTDLSTFHKAGCHRMLSLGDQDFLWHAEQALELYQHLFYPNGESTGDYLLSDSQLEARNNILEDARRNLSQAEQDHVEIQCDFAERVERFRAIYGYEPTAKDVSRACLNRHSKKYLLAVDGSAQDYESFIEHTFGITQKDENRKDGDAGTARKI